MIQIPLLNIPSQTFTSIIDAIEYSLRIIYNTRELTWSMDIAGGGFEIFGVSLVGGVDILAQYPILIKNMYVINVSGLTTDPTLAGLGTDWALIVATDVEVLEFELDE